MDEKTRVLVVDDDPDELELLTASLAPLGVQTAKAASGEEALRLVEGGRFSAAVMDLLMPRLNGFQTAALLRATPNGRDLPILILSGYDEAASRRIEGWEAVRGRVQYLEKPFSAEALRERVAAAYSPAWKRSEGLAPSL
jgi:CheY-like chemotaxis protein